ncbi:MAG: ATP-binding protein [Leptolyngbyaceae cyanobacterium bins.349]|nr:ATP-binding protein [Leptolyngbyaceae cyanobacterium bins.349]
MNLEEACRTADSAVFAKTGHHLTDVQMLILRGALLGQTYTQIAASSHYSVSYIKKFAGPALWQLLSQGLGEEVSKTSFQAALKRVALRPSVQAPRPQPEVSSDRHTPPRLAAVPNPSMFFGRDRELASLHQGIVQDHCRVVMVSGIGGIGKTTLLARFAREYSVEFDWVVFQSLGDAPMLLHVLSELLQAWLGSQATLPDHVQGHMQLFLELLKTHRCLIVLDQVEGILQSGELTGQYRQECHQFGEFFQQLAQGDHRSCLALLGRELPAALVALAGDELPIRHLKVRGLMPEAAQQLLQVKGVNTTQAGIAELIQMQRGNPLALQIVATTIQELFGGNVAQLLKQGTIIIGDTLLNLLNEQFERLSDLEKGVIYWLALEQQSLAQLRENTRFLVTSSSELLKTLQSLKRRSLLEEEPISEAGESSFTLQPIVARYVLKQLITQACTDVLTTIQTQSIRNLGLLRTHILFREDQFYQRRHTQTQPVVSSLMSELQICLGDERTLQQHLNDLLVGLHEKTTQAIGFATRNVVNLQHILESQRL